MAQSIPLAPVNGKGCTDKDCTYNNPTTVKTCERCGAKMK